MAFERSLCCVLFCMPCTCTVIVCLYRQNEVNGRVLHNAMLGGEGSRWNAETCDAMTVQSVWGTRGVQVRSREYIHSAHVA